MLLKLLQKQSLIYMYQQLDKKQRKSDKDKINIILEEKEN